MKREDVDFRVALRPKIIGVKQTRDYKGRGNIVDDRNSSGLRMDSHGTPEEAEKERNMQP